MKKTSNWIFLIIPVLLIGVYFIYNSFNHKRVIELPELDQKQKESLVELIKLSDGKYVLVDYDSIIIPIEPFDEIALNKSIKKPDPLSPVIQNMVAPLSEEFLEFDVTVRDFLIRRGDSIFFYNIQNRSIISKNRGTKINRLNDRIVAIKTDSLYGFYDLTIGKYVQPPMFTEYTYSYEGIICGKDGKFGIIHAETGENIISCIYDEISNINAYGVFIYRQNDEAGLMNLSENKTTIAPPGSKILSIEEEGFIIQKNDLVGYANQFGKLELIPEFQQIKVATQENLPRGGVRPIKVGPFAAKKKKDPTARMDLLVLKNNKWGIYNEAKPLLSIQFNSITPADNGYILEAHNLKYGYVSYSDLGQKLSLDTIYSSIKVDRLKNGEIYVIIQKNGKMGIANIEGEIIIPCEFKWVSTSGLPNAIKVQTNDGLYGWMNPQTGETIIKPQYETVNGDFEYKRDLVTVSKDGKTFRIRSDGRVSNGALSDFWDDLFNN